MVDVDEDVPQLSADTFTALAQFYAEQVQSQSKYFLLNRPFS
jgi:hypothetical protein